MNTPNLGVIIGKGHGNQRELAAAISGQGFKIVISKHTWPRDAYVKYQGIYIRNYEPENQNPWNVFGEGGYFQIGEDYILVSDRVYQDGKSEGRFINSQETVPMEQIIQREAVKYYPTARIHVTPSGEPHQSHKHIDMYTLLLSKSNLLILDTHFGGEVVQSKKYEAIAEKEGLNLIHYDGSQDSVWYPLNVLVLPTAQSEIVFLDKKATSLQQLLQKYNIPCIAVELEQTSYPTGKINCQTNTFDLKDEEKISSLFQDNNI